MRGWFVHLKARSRAAKPPLRIVRCIVARPCLVACLSFFVPVALSVAGIAILVRQDGSCTRCAGPFRTEDYPVSSIITKRSEALLIAMEESEEYEFESLRRRRRLSDGWAAASTPLPAASTGWAAASTPLPAASTTPLPAASTPLPAASAPRSAASAPLRRLSLGVSPAGRALAAARAVSEELMEPGDTRKRRALSSNQQVQQSEELAQALFSFMAEDSDGDAFSLRGLDELCELHNLMLGANGYADYCQREVVVQGEAHTEEMGECKPPLTPLTFFFGDASYDPSEDDVAAFDVENFDEVMSWALANPLASASDAAAATGCAQTECERVLDLRSRLNGPGGFLNHWLSGRTRCEGTPKNLRTVKRLVAKIRGSPSLSVYGSFINTFFDKGFSFDNLRSRYTRSFYEYGAPLDGFTSYITSSEKGDQDKMFVDWWDDENLRRAYTGSGWEELQPSALITSPKLLLREFLKVATYDGILAIVPIAAVFLIVWLHTGSLLLAFATLAEQVLSLTTALFFTAGVLQIKWLSFQHFLALYIVLAIGADDVFVFVDAWRQSFYAGPDVNRDLATRMSWVYRRAGLAMLITSLTTCASFIAMALSSREIPDLQNFGIFTALVIAIDYALVMTWLTAIVVIWHNNFEMKPGLCCACCGTADSGGKCCRGGCDLLCTYERAELATSTQVAQSGGAASVAKSRFTRFFEDGFPFRIVRNRWSRATSIVLMLAVLGPMIWQVSLLEPQTNPQQFLPDDHPFQRFTDANAQFYTSNEDETVVVSIVWGIDESAPLDTGGVNRLLDPEDKGSVNYNPSFALDAAAQEAMLDACARLEASDLVFSKLSSVDDTEHKEVWCWIREFRQWVVGAQSSSFPVQSNVVQTVLDWRDAVVAGGNEFPWSQDLGFADSLGQATILWTRVRAGTKLNKNAFFPANEIRSDYYEKWEAWLDGLNANATASLGLAMQTLEEEGTANKWVYMVLQELYTRMAAVGVGVGLAVAAVVLLCATRNFIASFLCMVSIASVLLTVIGCTVAMGWQLGSSEALCFMTLTGFAVDYVVHLAHSYMESGSGAALARTHDALRDMGISVFWGMATSFVAALALSLCQLQFLSKFGSFFLLTVSFAFVWSMLFLMPLLAAIGPRSEEGASLAKPDGSPQPVVRARATDETEADHCGVGFHVASSTSCKQSV